MTIDWGLYRNAAPVFYIREKEASGHFQECHCTECAEWNEEIGSVFEERGGWKSSADPISTRPILFVKKKEEAACVPAL